MKKYDLRKIMNRAWEIKHLDSLNVFSLCLAMAWKEAKSSKKAFSGVALLATENSGTKRFKLWENYGRHRIYITRDDGKKTYGYIDLDNGNALVCDHDVRWALVPATEQFFATYAVA